MKENMKVHKTLTNMRNNKRSELENCNSFFRTLYKTLNYNLKDKEKSIKITIATKKTQQNQSIKRDSWLHQKYKRRTVKRWHLYRWMNISCYQEKRHYCIYEMFYVNLMVTTQQISRAETQNIKRRLNKLPWKNTKL